MYKSYDIVFDHCKQISCYCQISTKDTLFMGSLNGDWKQNK